MSIRILSSTVLALLISSYPSISAIAQTQPSNPSMQLNQGTTIPEASAPPIQPNQRITIPESSVIAAAFCSAVKFETERKSRFPVTLFLARPIVDNDGRVLAPINSLVSAQVKPTSEGIQIQVDAMVVGGRLIPVKTSTLSVPSLSTVKQEDTTYYTYDTQNRGAMFNVANGLLQGWLPNQGLFPGTASDLLGAGLAIAAGIGAAADRPPKPGKVMEVPEGGTLIFPLLSPVALPPMAPWAVLSSAAQTPTSLCSKDIDNTQDSSDETSDETSGETSDETSNTD